MTLILALASEHEVHMTCDFKLTDARRGTPLSVNAHKLVPVRRPKLQAVVGVTGLAVLGGKAIGTWIAKQTGTLPINATLESLIGALRIVSHELDRVSASVRKHRHLSFVVGAIQGSQAVVVLLSNFQDFSGIWLPSGVAPGSEVEVAISRPSRPTLLVAGEVGAVRREERRSAERMLRAPLEARVVRERLAGLNRRAAQRVATVSEGCYAASEFATGTGETQPFLVEQTGDFIPPDLQEMTNKLGLQLNRATLPDGSPAPLQVRGVTSVGYAPSPSYFREQFKLRPEDSELWNNFGSYEHSEGRVDSARFAFEKALEFDANNYFAARNLGNLLWRSLGRSAEGRRWFEVALRQPDENHRRDTLSLLADTLLCCEGDIDSAEQYFNDAMEGELLPVVAARYACFLIDHRPERMADAERLLDQVLEREPYYNLANLGKALCMWHLHDDLKGARQRAIELAARFEKDDMLLGLAVHLSLAAGESDSAEELLSKLKSLRAVSALVASLSGLLVLCRGEDVDLAAAHFRDAGDQVNLLNLATVAWARGQNDECQAALDRIDAEELPAGAHVEYVLVSLLLADAKADLDRSEVGTQFESVALQVFDPTLLGCLARHPGISERVRDQIAQVLRSLGDSPDLPRG